MSTKFLYVCEDELSRAQRKRQEKAANRAETAAKRAEARQLAEQEEIELERSSSAARRWKVTEAELQRHRDEASAALHRAEKKRKREMRRCMDEKEYRSMVCVENTNRVGLDVDARNVDEALEQLTLPDEQLTLPEDRHPERRAIVLYKGFEETQLERLKEDKPGLTLGIYKTLILKLWKRSPHYRDFGLPKLNRISTGKLHSRRVVYDLR